MRWTPLTVISCVVGLLTVMALIVSVTLWIAQPMARMEARIETLDYNLQRVLNQDFLPRVQYERHRHEDIARELARQREIHEQLTEIKQRLAELGRRLESAY